MNINSVVLTGRAGRDPEQRFFESGKVLTTLSMAVNRPGKDSDTDWFEIKLWGKAAEICAEYVRKGQMFGIVGRIEQESWTDQQSGQNRSKHVIVANELKLAPKGDNRPAEQEQQAAPPADDFGDDEECPF